MCVRVSSVGSGVHFAQNTVKKWAKTTHKEEVEGPQSTPGSALWFIQEVCARGSSKVREQHTQKKRDQDLSSLIVSGVRVGVFKSEAIREGEARAVIQRELEQGFGENLLDF